MGRRSRQGDEDDDSGGLATSEWGEWVTLVDEDTRNEIADAVLAADAADFKGLVHITKLLTAEVIRGNLSLKVAKEIREWVNLMLGILMAENPKAQAPLFSIQAMFNNPEATPNRAPALGTRNTLDEILGESRDTRKPALIEVKKEGSTNG